MHYFGLMWWYFSNDWFLSATASKARIWSFKKKGESEVGCFHVTWLMNGEVLTWFWLSDFGSCMDELFGSLSSRNPTVIRWSMLDISGHDTNMDARRHTHQNKPSLSVLPLPSYINEGLISGWLWAAVISHILTLKIIQISLSCPHNMFS